METVYESDGFLDADGLPSGVRAKVGRDAEGHPCLAEVRVWATYGALLTTKTQVDAYLEWLATNVRAAAVAAGLLVPEPTS